MSGASVSGQVRTVFGHPQALRSSASGARAVVAVCAAALGVGCAGVQFEREANGSVYKALPYGTKAEVVERVADLPPPVEVIGRFAVRTDRGESDRAEVEARFAKAAPAKGCDLVSDIEMRAEEKRSTRTVRELGRDGAPVSRQEEVVKTEWHWTGQCVRSAKAGLAAEGPPASGPGSDRAGPKDTGEKAALPVVVDPETAKVTREVADHLLAKGDAWLASWRDKLTVASPDPMDVLEAFNELAYQVTGPGGFWRKTVPQNWFGCASDATTSQCMKLAKISDQFKPWDQVQAAITNLPRKHAGAFLLGNQRHLVGYLDTYVPAQPSHSAMTETLFYKASF